MEDALVGALSLAIRLGMGDRSEVESDPFLFAKFCHFPLGEVCAIVGDDAVRVTIVVDELSEELGCGLPVTFLDGLCFHPLGEFVNCDQEMREAGWRSLELAHHVESLDCEEPCDWDRLQCRAWYVRLVGVFLAPDAALDYCHRVGVGGELVEAMSKRLGD
jgi:hypothetical protein